MRNLFYMLAGPLFIAIAGCQAVDLKRQPTEITCAVSPADYKLLRFWNDRTKEKRYAKIVALLQEKYAGAPRVGGSSAVVAAQSYVRANSTLSPEAIEAKVRTTCKS